MKEWRKRKKKWKTLFQFDFGSFISHLIPQGCEYLLKHFNGNSFFFCSVIPKIPWVGGQFCVLVYCTNPGAFQPLSKFDRKHAQTHAHMHTYMGRATHFNIDSHKVICHITNILNQKYSTRISMNAHTYTHWNTTFMYDMVNKGKCVHNTPNTKKNQQQILTSHFLETNINSLLPSFSSTNNTRDTRWMKLLPIATNQYTWRKHILCWACLYSYYALSLALSLSFASRMCYSVAL